MMVQFDVKRVSNGTESFMVSFDFAKTPITQVADHIIIAAANNKTSDIHFDPRDEGMMVRFRIDGDCQDYTFIPKAYEKNLTTRLKLLANMNITETRLPQDGAIKGDFGGQYLDMRVACLPTSQGEKIVIRILDYTRSLQGIDSLGFHPKNLEKIKRMMGVPNGIILVTGATGSGKSTTTYSMLSGLNKPEVNVITVEDPVEMNIEGINQVQVNAEIGMTFAAALRSILREDPNVILIGEIRDSETAQIAVRASITGHLVMSTLHTNNALATVERLLDMDVERYLLSTALTGIVSQRLAKQLCQDCKVQRETTPYEKKIYKKFLHKDVATIWTANPKGCDNCRKGYRGRIAVHEVLELDERIRNALNDEKLSKEDFAKMIYTGKTISMLQDALIKALEGQTSFEEVYRTIEIENEDEDNYAQEISNISDKNEEENQSPNLPTGDDLLEDEISDNSQSSPIPTLTIPELVLENPFSEQTTNENEIINATVQTTQPIQTIEQNNLQVTELMDQSQNLNQIPAQSQIVTIEQIQNTSETTPLPPTIDVKSQEPNSTGYKIVMPGDTNNQQQNNILQEITSPAFNQSLTTENLLTPPIQEEYKITAEGLVEDAPLEQTIIPNVQEIVTTNITPTVQQMESPIYAQPKTEDSGMPSFDVKTNPTELANQLMQNVAQSSQATTQQSQIANQAFTPIVINENPVSAPIPNIQAVSMIPSIPQTSQQGITGSEILSEPGIRIAENQPISTPTQENNLQNNNPFIPNIIQ